MNEGIDEILTAENIRAQGFMELTSELIDYKGEDRVVHFTDYLLEKTKETKTKRFLSGSMFLDEKCALENGEVLIITGHTKAGKTLFAESWCQMMAEVSGAKVMILSFEVQAEKMLLKYMKKDQLPLYVPMNLKTMDFEWLRRRCLEAKLKYDCNIVLIDHLHFLVDMSTKQNMSLNIGAFMRRLKQDIAIKLNLGVILIAHQGQPKENQKEASVSGMRDSSFIGQESDGTIIVTRRENYGAADLKAFEDKYGAERVRKVLAPAVGFDLDDKYSAGLSVVKVACHRRTGVFDAKKLFRKVDNFLEEV